MRERQFRERVERAAEALVEVGEILAGGPEAMGPAVVEDVGREEWARLVRVMGDLWGGVSPPRSGAPTGEGGAGPPELATEGKGDSGGLGGVAGEVGATSVAVGKVGGKVEDVE